MKKFFLLPAIIFLFFFLFTHFPALAALPIGNYLVLNGGYVKAVNSNPAIPGAFNFSASIYPTNISGKQIILSIGDKNTGTRYYEIGINSGLLFVDYGYNGYSSLIKSSGLSAATWQDIKVEITTSQTKLLINGKEVAAPFISNILGPIGPNIVLGNSYQESIFASNSFKGFIDEIEISGSSAILNWHLDEARGETTVHDASGNNLNGALVGGDILIHFYGVLPTPTPYSFGLPPIDWSRPILPTLSLPSRLNPSPPGNTNPQPPDPTPTTSSIRSFPRRNL